ncbi:MAG: ARPP-1 family domain-containing protein [Pirellulaceae bacterium]
MIVALPKLRVGNPVRHEALSVFPLFTETSGSVEYRLCAEAVAEESVVVEEVNEGGSVPDLLVDNQGDVRVLFLEGEELVGAEVVRPILP